MRRTLRIEIVDLIDEMLDDARRHEMEAARRPQKAAMHHAAASAHRNNAASLKLILKNHPPPPPEPPPNEFLRKDGSPASERDIRKWTKKDPLAEAIQHANAAYHEAMEREVNRG